MIELHYGDCLEIMKSMPDKSVDAVITDPPYGTTNIKWDKPIDLKLFWKEILRISKDKSPILSFSSQPFTTDLINSNRKMFRYEIIWKKTTPSGFLNANVAPLRAHENIEVFYKKSIVYHPIKSKVVRTDLRRVRRQIACRAKQYRDMKMSDWIEKGERFPTDVIEFSNWNGVSFGNKRKDSTKHPTQKPVDLMSYLVLTFTNPGDVVFDPYMGSGTTAIACVQSGRNFIGIEIDPEYFKIAEKRIYDAQQQMRIEFPINQEVDITQYKEAVWL